MREDSKKNSPAVQTINSPDILSTYSTDEDFALFLCTATLALDMDQCPIVFCLEISKVLGTKHSYALT